MTNSDFKLGCSSGKLIQDKSPFQNFNSWRQQSRKRRHSQGDHDEKKNVELESFNMQACDSFCALISFTLHD